MKNYILIFVLGFISCSWVSAQNDDMGIQLSEIRKQKNDGDLDVKNMFRRSNGKTFLSKKPYEWGSLTDVEAVKFVGYTNSFKSADFSLRRAANELHHNAAFDTDRSFRNCPTEIVPFFMSKIWSYHENKRKTSNQRFQFEFKP